jgi:adenylate kinase
MRAEVEKKSSLGSSISAAMAEGRLVSDHLANQIAMQGLSEHIAKKSEVVILDGYPRTISQAEHLLENLSGVEFSAVHIMLERWVAIQKTLGRQTCKNCGGSFNSSDIRRDGYFMPALVPDPAKCPLKERCNPVYEKRSDDTLETAEIRYEEYLTKTTPLLDFYKDRNILTNFNVKKGIADVDLLMEAMHIEAVGNP